MSTTIEQLELEVQSSATSAIGGIDALASSLGKLKSAVKGGVGLTSVAKQLNTLKIALNSVSRENADNLSKLAQAMQILSSCGKLKISSSIATQITKIGNAVRSLNGIRFSDLGDLASALVPLTSVGKANLNSFISQLQKLPQAVQAFKGMSIGSLSTQIRGLVSALNPLTQIGKNNLTSFITQLRKLPEAVSALRSVDMGQLASQIQQLANAFSPLAMKMQSIANGFSALPTRLQRLIQQTNNLTVANNRNSLSYINLSAKIGIAWLAMKRIASVIAGWITKSNEYVESLNLFTVSLGKFATEAQKYAESVAEIMGIDPAEWLRNQGIFMTLATGFGVVNDRAYTMSKNLTQLGYDLSSFFNISYEDAFQKLQSGISGELEPLRRLGYDLSVARLQQEALSLGITKSVNAMTQAEKAELRYYAIMTQVTTAQGDMARTLEAPANQLRVLQSQVTQCARALGNIFIPALNAILPYAIAVAKVIRIIANIISGLFGFSLPEIDYSDISTVVGDVADGTGAIANGLGDANKKAKELKTALLGIDELNVISPPDSSAATGAGDAGGIGGGGLGFELPTYEFLGDAINSKVQAIVDKMKEWFGLTEDIDTWSELFHTKLGRILTTIGAIGLGFTAWKISKSVLNGLQYLTTLKGSGLDKPLMISLGITLAITGISLEWSGIIDAIQNELNNMNFAQIVGGGALISIGGAFIGQALGSAIIGGALGGIIAGVPAFVTGIYDSIKNGIDWLSAALVAIGSAATGAGIGAICAAAGTTITPGIGTLIGLAVGLVVDGIILIIQKWDTITEFLSNFFTDTIPGLWNDFVSWLGNVPNALGEFFGSLPEKISKWFDNIWKPIREYDWEGLGYNIGQWFGNAVKSAIDFVTVTIPNWFKNMWETIKTTFTTFFTVTLPHFFMVTLPEAFNTVVGFVQGIPEMLWNAIQTGWNWLVDIGKSIIDGIWEGLQTIWTAIKDFVGGFVQGFKDALGIHSPSTVFYNIALDLVAGFVNGIKGAWTNVTMFFQGAFDNLKAFFSNAWENIKTTTTNVWDKIQSSLSNTWDKIQSFAKTKFDDIKSIVESTWDNLKSTTSTIWSNIKTTLSTTWDNMVTTINTKFEEIKNRISTTWDSIKTKTGEVWGLITTSLSSKWESIKNSAKDKFNSVKNEIYTTWEDIKSKTSTIWSNVQSTLSTIWSDVKENASTTWANLKDTIGAGWNEISTNTSIAWDNIQSALSTAFNNIKTNATNVFTDIKNTIENIFINLWGSIKGVINSIIGGAEKMANGVISGINGMIRALNNINFSIPEWVPEIGGKSFGFNLRTISTIYIPRLAEGGFPKVGEMFIAREAGAEMVGSIGRKTAVANNDQIVSGIANGVAEANSEQTILLREQNSLLKALLEKESGVYLDGKNLTKSVEKYQRERGRVLVTGGIV